ncbi:MAG: NAD kinase [Verrucomicrobia subdivision 3 bacterium]|nr:NAD kinase [Limisphaerales bacterium]MCS1414572.1 NAD kinase [Limisphaerales bacterium]
MRQIHRIGLIANPEKARWEANLRKAAELIHNAKRIPVAPQLESGSQTTSNSSFCHHINEVKKTDLILVVGGDGTMLSTARALSGVKTPILGINTGNLGFLTTAPMANLRHVLATIWKGRFEIQSRPYIEATITTQGNFTRSIALNDFVISRSELSRMIQLNVSVDGEFLTTYQCDGLIVCSPTGSTAYSLSAGGPIVSPNTEVMTLTPICPHALSNRSVIVSFKSVIQVEVGIHRPETILTSDGQVSITLKPGDTIQFQQSKHRLHLLSVTGNEFFDTLRQKMKWSGSNV